MARVMQASERESVMATSLRLKELLDADWVRFLEFSGQLVRRRRWRDSFAPRFASVALIRYAQRLHARGFKGLAKLTSLCNFIVFGIEVPPGLAIGPGLVIPHTQGTIVGAGHVGRDV